MVVNLIKYIFGFQMLDTKTKNECTVSTSISLTCIPFKFFTGINPTGELKSEK
jgi:hypothetical protein